MHCIINLYFITVYRCLYCIRPIKQEEEPVHKECLPNYTLCIRCLQNEKCGTSYYCAKCLIHEEGMHCKIRHPWHMAVPPLSNEVCLYVHVYIHYSNNYAYKILMSLPILIFNYTKIALSVPLTTVIWQMTVRGLEQDESRNLHCGYSSRES